MTSKPVIPIGILKQKLSLSSESGLPEVVTKTTLTLDALKTGSLRVYGQAMSTLSNAEERVIASLNLNTQMGDYDRNMLMALLREDKDSGLGQEEALIKDFLEKNPKWYNTVQANHLIGVKIHLANILEIFNYQNPHPKTADWVFVWVYNAYQNYKEEEKRFGQ